MGEWHFAHSPQSGMISVNILDFGLGGLNRWIFWLTHWKFVEYPCARVVLHEHHVLARKTGSLRVLLYENRV